MSSRLRTTPARAEKLRQLIDSVSIPARAETTFRDSVTPMLLRNMSGEVIPPYSCVVPVGVIEEAGRPIIEVDQYDGAYLGEFLFTSHFEIGIGGTGLSQVGRVVRAAYVGGTGEGNYQPTGDEWHLTPGGIGFQAFGIAMTGQLIAAVVSRTVTPALAQAPTGGIPARVNQTPGSATCTVVFRSPTDGTGYLTGDLVKSSKTITVFNWSFDLLGDLGDRIVQVSGHYDGADVVSADCENEADPNDIVLWAAPEGP